MAATASPSATPDGEDDQGKVTLNINGTKTLDVQSGNNAPSIEGKYTFTLTGSEGDTDARHDRGA